MADMLEKYKKVRSEREAVPDGIIRVNRTIQARNFIDHVLDEFNNKGKDSVTLSSLGQAITKAVTIAEIVKHRVAGLHQVNEINTIVIDDEYEPLEEEKELDKMTVSRKLTCLQITLSKTAPKDITVAGYQPPIPESEVNPDAGPEDESRKTDNRRRRRARSATKTGKDGETPAGTDGEAKPQAAAAQTPAGETPAGDKPQGRGNGNRRGGNRQRARTGRPTAAGEATPAETNPFLDNKDKPKDGAQQQRTRMPRGDGAGNGGNRGGRGGRRGGRGGQGGAGAGAAGGAAAATGGDKPTKQ